MSIKVLGKMYILPEKGSYAENYFKDVVTPLERFRIQVEPEDKMVQVRVYDLKLGSEYPGVKFKGAEFPEYFPERILSQIKDGNTLEVFDPEIDAIFEMTADQIDSPVKGKFDDALFIATSY
jgi:hypothetical protein